jgi:hypothetical protein
MIESKIISIPQLSLLSDLNGGVLGNNLRDVLYAQKEQLVKSLVDATDPPELYRLQGAIALIDSLQSEIKGADEVLARRMTAQRQTR